MSLTKEQIAWWRNYMVSVDGMPDDVQKEINALCDMALNAEMLLSALRRASLALAFAAESSPAMKDDYRAVCVAISRAKGEA